METLAPAGNPQALDRAIAAGATAVYLGCSAFSARAGAGNFDETQLREAVTFAHLHHVRVHVTVNTLIKDSEMEEVKALLRLLNELRVDAVLVQDLGVVRMARACFPDLPIHASTQMDNRTPEKVRFLEEAGFTQVVLARELTLEQIRGIAEQTSVPLEVFVHGALCVSYSGQCYLSAALNGRSANRGECAQLCRLPYRMIDAEGREIVAGKYLLSLKDMNRSDQLEELLDAGVSSLKIEGRLKEVSYVKNVTAYYRQRLDAIFARRTEYRRSSYGRSHFDFEPALEKSFNRGFTPFFLHGRRADITSFDTPKSLGEPIGTVKALKGNSFTIAGVKALHNGDGLTFFNARGELEGFRVNRVENNQVFTLDRPMIRPKMALYRNVDQAFENTLAKPSAERKLAVEMTFADNPFGFTLSLKEESGASVSIGKPFQKELARTDQSANIRTQLAKLGNTPFEASAVEVQLSEPWFVPSSLLAEMRREGVERLLAAKRIRYRRKEQRFTPTHAQFPEKRLTYLGNVANSRAEAFYRVHGVEQVEPAFEQRPRKEVPLMFTKHCLRYSMGWCPRYQKGKSPFKEPYFLQYKETTLRLRFDCVNCQMLIYQSETK